MTSVISPFRLFQPSAAAAAIAATWLCAAGQAWAQTTTVPVYLPGYDAADWKALRGSVITSDKSMTTYTIFCAQQTPLACVLDDTLPFLFAEGSSSMSFGGAMPGEITADLRCDLAGTTAATCSGYSSLGEGFHEGPFTGPAETRWTRTFSGSDLQWGVLTLTAAPTTTLTSNLDGTVIETDPTTTSNPTLSSNPSAPTSAAAAARKRNGKLSYAAALASGSAILAGFLL